MVNKVLSARYGLQTFRLDCNWFTS